MEHASGCHTLERPDYPCPCGAEHAAQLARYKAVVTWCIGHAQRDDDQGALRAVLRENGFIE